MDPKASLPESFRNPSQLEGTYRFFGNERIDLGTVVAGHVSNTVRRVDVAKRALAIHDTTSFVFDGERDGLGIVDRSQQGFYAHACLAVSADGVRQPLGLLALDTWMRTKKKGKRTTEARRNEKELESDRWLEQSLAVEELVSNSTVLIHVEDREGDIYESLATRAQRGMHFIVRASSNRVVKLEGGGTQNVLESARTLPLRSKREVDLSERHNPFAHLPKTSHGNRQARTTQVEIRSGELTLRRPQRALRSSDLPKELRLNVVHVGEVDAPPGEKAVEWLLFTTEPVDSATDAEQVVDFYRTRWLIEEYFKALKTGCKYEDKRLESGPALLNALGVFAIVAWRLLVLRFIDRTADDSPAESVATDAEIAVLVAKKRLKPNATAREFTTALARYGGHLPQNGPPGLLILWRALRALQQVAEGWSLAQEM